MSPNYVISENLLQFFLLIGITLHNIVPLILFSWWLLAADVIALSTSPCTFIEPFFPQSGSLKTHFSKSHILIIG